MRAVHESSWLVKLYECEILDHVGMGEENLAGMGILLKLGCVDLEQKRPNLMMERMHNMKVHSVP